MNLGLEIQQGLSAAKQARDLVWDPERKEREEIWKIIKRENDDYAARQKQKQDQIAAGRNPAATQATTAPAPLVTSASGASPGTQATTGPTALNTSPPAYRDPNAMGSFRRGGRVRRYAGGGIVGVTGVDDVPVNPYEGADDWASTVEEMGRKPASEVAKEQGGGSSKSDLDTGYWLKKIMAGRSGEGPNSGGTPPFNPDPSQAPDMSGTGGTYAEGGMVRQAFCPHCGHYIGHGRG